MSTGLLADSPTVIRHAMDIMALAERHDELTDVGPLAAPGRLRRLAPFALVAVVAAVMLLTERPQSTVPVRSLSHARWRC